MRELLRRIHYFLHRRRMDDELAEELEFHREMAKRSEGKRLGDSLRLREDSREAWGWMWIDRLGQDLRFAFRTLHSSPGFTVAAVLVLAIGIGATVAAFASFNLVVLRPLPVTDPHSLLRFQRQGPGQFWSDVPYPAIAFYRENTRTLSAVLALTTARLSVDGDDSASRTYFVTGNFFTELGATPAAGRLFTTADEAPSAAPMVVLGHGFWTTRFGKNPGVVGTSIRLNGAAATVIGVAAREFSGLGSDAPAFWAILEEPVRATYPRCPAGRSRGRPPRRHRSDRGLSRHRGTRGLCGRSAYEGDRDPHGDRRPTRTHSARSGRPIPAHRGSWPSCGCGRCGGTFATPSTGALRPEYVRPVELPRRGRALRLRDWSCRSCAGEASPACRSAHRPPL